MGLSPLLQSSTSLKVSENYKIDFDYFVSGTPNKKVPR